MDGGSEPPDSGTPPSLTLTFLSPTGVTYSRDTVSVQLDLQGDAPERVELLVDDQLLTQLVAPYTFEWSTSAVLEGTHELTARAHIGDQTFSSEARIVVVDRTPPGLASRQPAPGAQDVWVRQPIQAVFSEPVKLSTLMQDSVKLAVEGTEVNATLSLSEDGRTLTVTPSTRPTVPASLELTLTAAITDLAGNPLVVPSEVWEWSLPTSFPMGGLSGAPGLTSADQPFIQVTPEGQPFVIWREEIEPTEFNTYVYRWTGSDWEPMGGALNPQPTGEQFRTNSTIPHMLRLDPSGIPIVAWIQSTGTELGIHVRRWLNNQWLPLGSPLNAFPGTSSYPRSLSLQVDTNAKPIITWEQENPSTQARYIHTWKWTGENWSELGAPLPIASRAAAVAGPALALDPFNRPFVAWSDSAGDRTIDGINVRRWTGSEWEALGTAVDANPSSGTQAYQPRLILDSSNNPIIAWNEYDGSAFNVHVRRWTGNDWEPMELLLSALPGATDAVNAELASDAQSRLFITWHESNQSPPSYFFHFRQWNGTNWENVGAPIESTAAPSLSIDNSGKPFLAWLAADPPSFIGYIRVHRYNY